MCNQYLFSIYEVLYDEVFSYSDFSNRVKMQRLIYLLQELGVPIGNYGFMWYKHGLYSQQLQCDMRCEDDNIDIYSKISKDNKESINTLRSIIQHEERREYSMSYWVECLASLHHLRNYVLRYGAGLEGTIEELEVRLPHLNNHQINIMAYKLVEEMFV